jgi:hypothetical protein
VPIKFRQERYEGTLTPVGTDRPTIIQPGYGGGVNWGSVSVDVDRGIMVASWLRLPTQAQLVTRAEARARDFKITDGKGPVPGPNVAGQLHPPELSAQLGILHPGGRRPSIARSYAVALIELLAQEGYEVESLGHMRGGTGCRRLCRGSHVVAGSGPTLDDAKGDEAVIGHCHGNPAGDG